MSCFCSWRSALGNGVGVGCSISEGLNLLGESVSIWEDVIEVGVATSDFVGDIDLARSVDHEC